MVFEFPWDYFWEHYLLYVILIGLVLRKKLKGNKSYFVSVLAFSAVLGVVVSSAFSYLKINVINNKISEGAEFTVSGRVTKVINYNGFDKLLINNHEISIPYHGLVCKNGRGLVKEGDNVTISIVELDYIPFYLEGKCITKLQHNSSTNNIIIY